MVMVRMLQHKKEEGGCGNLWMYKGKQTEGFVNCSRCKKAFKLSNKDSRALTKLAEIKIKEREHG